MYYEIIGYRTNKYLLLQRILEYEIKKEKLILGFLRQKVHPGIEDIILSYDDSLFYTKNKIIDQWKKYTLREWPQEWKFLNIQMIITILKEPSKYIVEFNEDQIYSLVNCMLHNFFLDYETDDYIYKISMYGVYDECVIGTKILVFDDKSEWIEEFINLEELIQMRQMIYQKLLERQILRSEDKLGLYKVFVH
jgi:hypothetical protein